MATQIDYTRVTPNIDIQAARNGIEIDVSKRGLRGPRGEQGPGVGETVASITSGRGFWPLRKALAAGTARVVAMGDSKTEGAGVETVDQRWLDQLMGTLRARYAPSGDQGLGYLPAYYATFYGFPSAPTTSGSAVTVGNGGGLGNRSRHLEAGGSVTWTVPAWTSGVPLLVHWTQHPGLGSLQVVTGSTVRGTIATGGSTIESKVTAVTIPAGTTSITVRHQSGTGTGNAARVEGIVHRTATTGVTIYDGARSGAKLVDYSQGLVNDGAPLSDDWHFQALAAVQPHAVILAFGANDQASRTPAQWGADLRTVVDKAKDAAPGAGIIVLHGAQRTEDVTADPSRILAFEAAARDAVGADPDVTILYESTLWKPTAGVDYTSSDPSGWLADTVHTGPAANAQIARYLAAQITGADAATDAVALVQPALTAAQAAQAAAEDARDRVGEFRVTPESTTFATSSKNLLDATAGQDGMFWDRDAQDPIPLAGYWASELTPVTAGETYTAQGVRIIGFRDATGARVPSSLYINDATYGVNTFTPPAGTAFISVSTTPDRKGIAQVEVGATATAHESYGLTLPGLLIEGQTIEGYVGSLIGQSETVDSGLTVYRDGDDIVIRHGFDSTRDLIQPVSLNRDGFGGPRVQLVNSYRTAVTLTAKGSPTIDIAAAPLSGETGIHVTSDDIAPIYAGGSFIGAGHGWAAGPRMTATGHGKTTADLGSQWSDGTRTYTLLQVLDANTLILGGPYTLSAGRATVSTVMPTGGDLTHVSGATNTGALSGTCVLEQIGPVSHSRSVAAHLDGVPIRDGFTTGRELTISETYTLISYQGLITWAQAHIGSDPFADLTVPPPLARLTSTYRWEGRDCTVGQTVHALEVMSLYTHVTQAAALSVNGGSLTQFFPGATGTMGGVNLATEWAHSAQTGSVAPGVTQQVDPGDPIARTYTWHNKAGARDYGLVVGLLPVMDGKPATRKANGTDGANWSMPTTKKMYPRLTGTKTLSPGQSLNAVAFRRYLSGEDEPVVPISDGHRSWVLIDGATPAAGATPLPQLQGNALTVIGSTNVTAGSYVTPEGVTYSRPASGRYIAEARVDTSA